MQIEAAVQYGDRESLQFESLELEEPRNDELLIKLVATGICHTDIKAMDPQSRVPRPAVLGHEGAGVVERVGTGISGLEPGDHVVMTVNSCGYCRSCVSHLPGYCLSVGALNFGGSRPDGSKALKNACGNVSSHFFGQSSFATHAICTERNAVKVARDLPLELLAPLGCGVQTGAGSVLNTFRLIPGQTIAVFGAGAVGLSAVIAASLSGASKIIAVDTVEKRLILATELGASHTFDATSGDDVVQFILEQTSGGVDYSLDTTGDVGVIGQAMQSLAPTGTCGVLATPAGQRVIEVKPSALILGGRSLKGIVQGGSDPKRFIPEMIDLFRAGRFPFDRLISYYPFSSINEAVADAKSGLTVKPVILF